MNHPIRKNKPSTGYHLRWCWLGCGLAAILWFGSDLYYQRVEQIDEIESLSSSVSRDETPSLTAQRKRNNQWHHYAAIAIAVGSITYGGKMALRAAQLR